MDNVWKFFVAFLFVLVLIGVAAWLVRRFGMARAGVGNNRGRAPRLAVIDAAPVDGRRRLVLVRRDNVEHLLMIGGPSDIVVEPNILRAPGARVAEPGRGAAPMPEPAWDSELAPRPEPIDYSAPPPMPEPPPRPLRPAPERRSEPFAAAAEPAFAPEPLTRPAPHDRELPLREREPQMRERSEPPPQRQASPMRAPAPEFPPRPPARNAPPPRMPAPPVQADTRGAEPRIADAKTEDQNLAEMAQRLEAALRRPTLGDAKPAAAAPQSPAPPRAPAPQPPAPLVSEPASDTAPPVAPQPPEHPAEPAGAPAAKSPDLKSLEDEMASLLGRPKNSS